MTEVISFIAQSTNDLSNAPKTLIEIVVRNITKSKVQHIMKMRGKSYIDFNEGRLRYGM